MDDEFSKLSPEDQAKLKALQAEWERDGQAAFDRVREADPVFFFRVMAAINPRAARKALEDAAIDAGLTDADIREMLAKALSKH
jgi:hypothetical protein